MTILKSRKRDRLWNRWFQREERRDYLVFPKSLKRFADKRVVGIDWTLISE